MAADPTFNLKTGADSEIIFSRVDTRKKIGTADNADFQKIKSKDGVHNYPFLSRSTGNSIKGTTDSIESNELRKGRTKSAPIRGNASSEGSQDIELSPITYDDIFEAVFRNKWVRWTSDTLSASNKDGKSFEDGYFATMASKNGSKKLVDITGGGDPTPTATDADDSNGLFSVPEGSVIHELTCGTEDIKYDLLKKFGGVTGEDLYQEFRNMAVNTLQINVAVGAIVTGSIGFMGSNDPKMLDETEIATALDNTGFVDADQTGANYVANLPEKSTSTDQFTAREGFLYVNGKNIEFANSLDMTIDNGLEKKYAIFVPNAISTSPLTLDITGTLQTYLVKDGSENIFNEAVEGNDNEILFCFQDKDYDNEVTPTVKPKYLYIFQIFKSKFTDHDNSASGADTYDVSFPYQSFGERAVRLFRITVPRIDSVSLTEDSDTYTKMVCIPNIEMESTDADPATIVSTVKLDDTDVAGAWSFEDSNLVFSFDTAISKTTAEQKFTADITFKGETTNFSYIIPASE